MKPVKYHKVNLVINLTFNVKYQVNKINNACIACKKLVFLGR